MALGFGAIKNGIGMLQQYNQMQKMMKSVRATGYSKSKKVSVTMDGTNSITEMTIDDSLMDNKLKDMMIKEIKEAVDNSKSAVQQEMAKNMDMDQVKGMLGNLV